MSNCKRLAADKATDVLTQAKSDMKLIAEMELVENKFYSLERAQEVRNAYKINENRYFALLSKEDDYEHQYYALQEFQIHSEDRVPLQVGDVVYDYDNVAYQIQEMVCDGLQDGYEESYDLWRMKYKRIDTGETQEKRWTFHSSSWKGDTTESHVRYFDGVRATFWTSVDREEYMGEVKAKEEEKEQKKQAKDTAKNLAMFFGYSMLATALIAGLGFICIFGGSAVIGMAKNVFTTGFETANLLTYIVAFLIAIFILFVVIVLVKSFISAIYYRSSIFEEIKDTLDDIGFCISYLF